MRYRLTKSAKIRYREAAGAALLVGCALLGLLNVIAAVLKGAVLVRASGWVSFVEHPILFTYGVVMSAFGFLGLGGLAVLIVRGLLYEPRALERKAAAPRLEPLSDCKTRAQARSGMVWLRRGGYREAA